MEHIVKYFLLLKKQSWGLLVFSEQDYDLEDHVYYLNVNESVHYRVRHQINQFGNNVLLRLAEYHVVKKNKWRVY